MLYFLWGLLPDVRDELAESGNPVCRACWRWLASWRGRVRLFTLQRRLYFSSFFILFFYVMSNSFIAWDFGMTLVSHYHSSVYPLYYIQGINLAGAAAILLMSAVLWRSEGLKDWFDAGRLKQMGILITSFSLLWLYMFWAQFFVSWFGNLDYEYGVVSLQMYGHYQPFFWVMVSCMFFAPLLCGLAAWVKRTWAGHAGAVGIDRRGFLDQPLSQRPADTGTGACAVRRCQGMADRGFRAVLMVLPGPRDVPQHADDLRLADQPLRNRRATRSRL